MWQRSKLYYDKSIQKGKKFKTCIRYKKCYMRNIRWIKYKKCYIRKSHREHHPWGEKFKFPLILETRSGHCFGFFVCCFCFFHFYIDPIIWAMKRSKSSPDWKGKIKTFIWSIWRELDNIYIPQNTHTYNTQTQHNTHT